MHARRTAILAISFFGALGLAACGSSTATTATTATTAGHTATTTATTPSTTAGSTATTATTAPGGTTATSRLCGDLADLSKEEQGLVSAEQTATGPSGSLSGLQSYAKQAKSTFDKTGTKVTEDLASSPGIVQSAWSTLQGQIDQVFESAMTSPTLQAFTRAASSIESTNTFLGSNQTVTAFIKAVCPSGPAG